MSEFKLQGLNESTLDKIKSIADTDTIVGTHIQLPNGITIIPISKVTFGVTTGGSDWPAKNVNQAMFSGGSGAGMSVNPVAFIVVKGDDVKMLQLSDQPNNTNSIINIVPELFDKVTDLFKKDKSDKCGDKTEGDSDKNCNDTSIN